MLDMAVMGLTRFLVGGPAYWTGSEPEDRQRIYFANHGSHLDSLLIWAALPKALRVKTHPVAAADYWGHGLKGKLARRVLKTVLMERPSDAAPFNRKLPAQSLGALENTLQQGGSLILFPEGTRSPDPLPRAFKAGLHRLATAFPDIELLPVFLENPARAWPKGALLPAPIACSVRFGAPLQRIDGEAKRDFLARAHQAVTALAPKVTLL
jgi:1-acyl-sn-glycerol-3-phosphate acyltransferase